MTNAIQFIKDHGVDKAREVVEGAPDSAAYFLYDSYYRNRNPVEWYYWEENQWKFTSYSEKFGHLLVDLRDLERLIDSFDLVGLLGGIELLKRKIDGKHIGYTHFNINGNGRWSFLDHYIDFIPDGAYHIGMVNKAIADYESIYGGEHV